MVHLLLLIIYLAFIALGLPDGMLGGAWPSMHQGLGVPLYYAGIISMIIALCTAFSSLQTDYLTKKTGTGRITLISVGLTAIGIMGFAFSSSFIAICLWAIPYGLGAGCVDASLNNYVAINYESRHMSWLHCMWGVGATFGPYVTGVALSLKKGWQGGYLYIGILQIMITFVLLFTLPLWKNDRGTAKTETADKRAVRFSDLLKMKGVKEVMFSFFAYCALEQSAGLWASSYMALSKGVTTSDAARYASYFFLGITAGRGLSGIISIKLNDIRLIRLGQAIIALGAVMMLLPYGVMVKVTGLILVGLGCAPIFPSISHATPVHFGKDDSQAIIGLETASAYLGISFIPPVLGLISKFVSVNILPGFILLMLAILMFYHEKLVMKTGCYNEKSMLTLIGIRAHNQ